MAGTLVTLKVLEVLLSKDYGKNIALSKFLMLDFFCETLPVD